MCTLRYCLNYNCVPDVKPYADRLVAGVMHLLRNTPAESVAVRRDLLNGLQHIWAHETLRTGFHTELDTLLQVCVCVCVLCVCVCVCVCV